MSIFKYKIKKADGKIEIGEKEAQDKFVLYKQFHSEGVDVISISEGGKKGWNINLSIPGFSGVKTHDKIIFARNLGAMLEAGLSLSRALNVIIKQSRNKKFTVILSGIQEEINQGKTLSDALAKFPKVFPAIFVSMSRADEESGGLADALKSVANQMDKMYTIQRKVKGAMVYPAVILIVMITIAILMLIYIVPTLTSTFSELNVELPASTKLIIALSDFIRNKFILFLGMIILVIGGIYYAVKTPLGKRFLDRLIIKLPLIGELIKQFNSARTARTLASLLSAGVDVIESLKITSEVMRNVFYKEVLVKSMDQVQKGDPISKIFLDYSDLYPVFVGEMMSVGEETGKMSDMLKGVAQFYEDEVEQKTKDMSSIIEPVLMVIIGIGVGFFAISMIMPMYSLADKI